MRSVNKVIISIIVVVIIAIIGISVWYFLMTPGAREYVIRFREFAFIIEGTSFPLKIKAGETIKIKFINEGAVEHELMIVKDKDQVLKMAHALIEELQAQGFSGEDLIKAFEERHHEMEEDIEKRGLLLFKVELGSGEEIIKELKIDTPGTYWAVCLELEGSAPKTHTDMGMYAQIIVD